MIRLPVVIAAFFVLTGPAFVQAANDAAWEHVPSGADFARVYPAPARTQHVGGQVLLNCLILRTQRLRCRVVSEDPRGMGFGAAALQLAREFRVAARTHDGRPTAGGHIGVPLNFTVQRRPPTP